MEQLTIYLLKSFFTLFKANIEEYKVVNEAVFGTISWLHEDDTQHFVSKGNFSKLTIAKIKLLCDFLLKKELVDGDRIIVAEDELVAMLKKEGWDENEAENTINTLCSLDVRMIDEGEETDSFFLHF